MPEIDLDAVLVSALGYNPKHKLGGPEAERVRAANDVLNFVDCELDVLLGERVIPLFPIRDGIQLAKDLASHDLSIRCWVYGIETRYKLA